jgi:hypothetical protein
MGRSLSKTHSTFPLERSPPNRSDKLSPIEYSYEFIDYTSSQRTYHIALYCDEGHRHAPQTAISSTRRPIPAPFSKSITAVGRAGTCETKHHLKSRGRPQSPIPTPAKRPIFRSRTAPSREEWQDQIHLSSLSLVRARQLFRWVRPAAGIRHLRPPAPFR